MKKDEEIKENDEKYWYVLFVKVGYENRVVNQLKTYFDKEDILPFIPKMEIFHKYANKFIQKENKIMFPGYVFIESSIESIVFVGMIKKFIRYHEAPLRLLQYGNSCEFAMRKHEKSLLLSFCNKDNCIEVSTGLIQGDKATVIQGPLKGRENIIKKIDRSKRKAIIELELMGQSVPIMVGLDILRKLP